MKKMNPEADKKYLAIAIELALANVDNGGGPFGAAIVRNGELISTGVNQVTETADPTAHAEIMAIRKASEKIGSHELEDCIIYSSSEPCPMCLGAIYWAGINRLVFASGKNKAEKAGFIDAHIYREMERALDERAMSTTQIEIPGAGKEFEAWADKADKKNY